MNNRGKIGVALAVIGTGVAMTSKAAETATIWFDVPNTGSNPSLTQPGVPVWVGVGYTTVLAQILADNLQGAWNSFCPLCLTRLSLLDGSDPIQQGLTVPTLDGLFTLLNVPAGLRGDLVSVQLNMTLYTRIQYDFAWDQVSDDQTGQSISTTVTLEVRDLKVPQDTAVTGTFDVEAPPGVLVDQDFTLTATGVDIGDGTTYPQFVTRVVEASQVAQVSITSGTSFDIFNDPTYQTAALPIQFLAPATGEGDGNYELTLNTWGGAVFSLTYTWIPESDWAWAGLPVVFGGWMLRRRMVSARQQNAAQV